MAKSGIFDRRAGRAAATVLVTGVVALGIAAAPALPGSSSVAGRLVSQPVTDADCQAASGLCLRGEIKGGLKGSFSLALSDRVPTVDTPLTGVLHYVGDLTITTDDGTLTCKDAGVFASTGDRAAASVCTVIGGTGDFAGSSGRLRFTGTFPDFSGQAVDPAGTATYEGTVE